MRSLHPLVACFACVGLSCGPPDGPGPGPGQDPADGDPEACFEGECHPCTAAALRKSYLGCEYWPVDLDNAIAVLGPSWGSTDCSDYEAGSVALFTDVCNTPFNGVQGLCDPGGDCSQASVGASCQNLGVCVLDAQHAPYAIVAANPDASQSVEVTLENAQGMRISRLLAPGEVAALLPQELGFPDQSLDGSGIGPHAYRLTSTLPIVAYQFNPLDDVGVFSNEASLLLPTATHGTRYLGLTYPSQRYRPTSQDPRGYLTVVASSPGTTTVEITPTAAVQAGPGMTALAPGATRSFTLAQFETLTVQADAPGDLTASVVSGDQPFGVFAGHEAAAVSADGTDRCYADHLEDQLFPTSTWGKRYLLGRSEVRRDEPDLLRVLAQKPGTAVTFDPPGPSCPVLGPGEHCDVVAPGDLEIAASEPILVAHYLTSIAACDGFDLKPPGDPSVAFLVPAEQFRTSYPFLVPAAYAENRAAVVAPAGAVVLLDGADVAGSLTPFASGAYAAGRIPVTAGAHRLDCPEGCGLELSGWSETVSYLFAGGLDLRDIVID